MAKNEIQKANENSALMSADSAMPEWLSKGSKRGSEEVDSTDIVLPRVDVIQAISPQIKKGDPKKIESAEAGMLFNTLTSELYGEAGVIFVPVIFRKEWVAFKDRKKGGGFKGAWPFAEEVKANQAVEEMEDSADIELLESHNHIGYIVKADGSLEQAIFSCTKSKIKFSRKLNSLVTMAGLDRFAKAYQVFPISATNAAGDDYFTFDIKPMGFVTKAVYQEAEAMYEVMKDKKIGTNYAEDDSEHAASNESVAHEKEF